jgi:hypothetical protein
MFRRGFVPILPSFPAVRCGAVNQEKVRVDQHASNTTLAIRAVATVTAIHTKSRTGYNNMA